jgi:HD-GYP domain-containing protein (c-di-GMP phosphodiesterase class II)
MKQRKTWHLRILYLLLLILVGISVLPLWFYGSKMIQTNQETLKTQEQIFQTTIAQSLGQETSLYMTNLRQAFSELYDTVLPLASEIEASKLSSDPRLRSALDGFVAGPHKDAMVYVTAVNDEALGQGAQAPGYNVAKDAFVVKLLNSAFIAARQGQEYQSDPPINTATRKGREVVLVLGRPLKAKGKFLGMVGAVVTLNHITMRLQEATQSTTGLEAYIVDSSGHLVASNNPDARVPGMDMLGVPIVRQFLSPGGANATATSEFDYSEGSTTSRMLGTCSDVQSVKWGVIVQRKLSDAYQSVTQMRHDTMLFGGLVVCVSLVIAVLAAMSITRPIDRLAETARAIAQRDFTQRADIRSHTEVGELAQTFNQMADDIQHYIGELTAASEQNRHLFIDSIEMIAAAVDAKDPYTKGHSGRVAQYSVILAKELGLPEEEIDKIRISATLHDVGKIGIEDRVLKKPGVLTNEEFDLMKRHTVMGYEIVRQVKQLAEMLPGIRWHHEALNGKGYPDGINGDELPLMARVIAVADTFDAVTTDRPYQAGSDFPKALDILRKHAGTRYDPIVVDAMHSAHTKGALRKLEVRRVALEATPAPAPQATP